MGLARARNRIHPFLADGNISGDYSVRTVPLPNFVVWKGEENRKKEAK
jgi:hypothetical protein